MSPSSCRVYTLPVKLSQTQSETGQQLTISHDILADWNRHRPSVFYFCEQNTEKRERNFEFYLKNKWKKPRCAVWLDRVFGNNCEDVTTFNSMVELFSPCFYEQHKRLSKAFLFGYYYWLLWQHRSSKTGGRSPCCRFYDHSRLVACHWLRDNFAYSSFAISAITSVYSSSVDSVPFCSVTRVPFLEIRVSSVTSSLSFLFNLDPSSYSIWARTGDQSGQRRWSQVEWWKGPRIEFLLPINSMDYEVQTHLDFTFLNRNLYTSCYGA